MEDIKKIVLRQRVEYALFWVLTLIIFIVFESDVEAEGMYAGNARMEYILETCGILLAILFIPLSLKLFSLALVKRIRSYPLKKALKSYQLWSEIRLLMLAVVVYLNLTIYYLTMNNIGGLCALMGLTTSLYCWPGLQRVMNELDLPEE